MLCYLINLDDSKDRLGEADVQLRNEGIAYERISAFDGRGANPNDFPNYDEACAIDFIGRPLTGGELGCYFSHLNCAKAFLDTDADYVVVVEDDLDLVNGASQHLRAIPKHLNETRPNWEIVNIGLAAHKIYKPIANFGSHSLQHAFYFPVTTTGIIWSRSGAERFVATEDRIFAPVDHFFRRFFCEAGTGFAVSPPLLNPSGAESDIDLGGSGPVELRRDAKKSFLYFWSEFKRQSYNYANALRNYYKKP